MFVEFVSTNISLSPSGRDHHQIWFVQHITKRRKMWKWWQNYVYKLPVPYPRLLVLIGLVQLYRESRKHGKCVNSFIIIISTFSIYCSSAKNVTCAFCANVNSALCVVIYRFIGIIMCASELIVKFLCQTLVSGAPDGFAKLR